MMTQALTAPERPANPLSFQMKEALDVFNATGYRIEAYYQKLASEVYRLTGELEASNLELRRNLAEREKMQAILVSTLQSLTVGVLAVGQDGVVIVANPAACRMLDRPLDQIATRRIEEIVAEIPGSEELLLTLQGAGGGRKYVAWNTQHPGRATRHIELVASRALPPYDLHLAGVILAEDQTELKRLEYQSQLRSRLTGMGEIAMNLAHEIRNPLGSIALFASALSRDLEQDESLGPLAEQIVSGVKALEHLVANTLEFAKPRRMAMARVNLREVLRDTLVYVEHPLCQKQVQVHYDHDLVPEAWIAADAEQLRQVFLNLFINSIQAMEEGGTLQIGIRGADEGGWEVAISDDGIGIPEEMLGKIFDPFFTTKDKGSGIGLAIVHTILMAHNARIEVQSRVAAGTTFRVTFPRTREFEGI